MNNMMENNTQPPKITAIALLKQAFDVYYPEKKTKQSTYVTQAYRFNVVSAFIHESGKDNTPDILIQEFIDDYQDYLRNSGKSDQSVDQYVRLVCRLINNVLAVNKEFIDYHIPVVRYKQKQ